MEHSVHVKAIMPGRPRDCQPRGVVAVPGPTTGPAASSADILLGYGAALWGVGLTGRRVKGTLDTIEGAAMAGWRRLGGRVVLVCVMFVGGYLGMGPVPAAEADHQFGDVPNAAFYHNFVDFLVDNAITQGCSVNPPLYCPGQAVTRGQVAVFLKKTADAIRPAPANRPFHVFVACSGTTRFAVVSAAGTFVRGSAGTTSSFIGTGAYQVAFNLDVSACSWQVTVGTSADGTTTGVGNVALRESNNNALFVTVQDVEF